MRKLYFALGFGLMNIVDEEKLHGTSMKYSAIKQ